MTETKRSWLTIAAIWLTLLVLACIRPLSLPDEGRYADIGRWMLVSGDWLVPRLNGIPFFHKPPLLYWLQAEVFRFAGVSVWAARFVIASHALLLLVCLHLGVRKVYGELFSRRVSWVLGTSVGFLIGGQYINHDFLVATWIAVAIGFFALSFEPADRPDAWLARLGFVACGMGVLSKGLIGAVLPGLVIVVWLLVTGQIRQLLRWPWLTGLLLFCAVALPWMLWVQSEFAGFLDYFIIGQHFSRFTGSHFNNAQPWWFYLPVIGIFLGPWILVLLWGLGGSARALLKQGNTGTRQTDRWAVLLWVWLLVILAFFSLTTSKLAGYILPVIVPAAVLAARSWDRLTAHKPSAKTWFYGVCSLSFALAVGGNFLARYNSLQDASLDTTQALRCLMQSGDRVHVAGGYPYDLPFEANLQQALVVVQDWDDVRQNVSDDWRRTFVDGADFDAIAGQALQAVSTLEHPPANGKNWLVTPADYEIPFASTPWQVVYKGQAWWLWRAGRSATAANETMARERPGCLSARSAQP